jgi:hypothetical protein
MEISAGNVASPVSFFNGKGLSMWRRQMEMPLKGNEVQFLILPTQMEFKSGLHFFIIF